MFNYLFTSIKNFCLTNDYLDFKLGALFMFLLSMPLSDFFGVVLKVIGSLTGLVLLIKACYGVYNEYLHSLKLKIDKKQKELEIKKLKSKLKHAEEI